MISISVYYHELFANPAQGVDGYWIKAYRPLTRTMVEDLMTDTQRWRQEIAHSAVVYQSSVTHNSRQYYGPAEQTYPTLEMSTGETDPRFTLGPGYIQSQYVGGDQFYYPQPAQSSHDYQEAPVYNARRRPAQQYERYS